MKTTLISTLLCTVACAAFGQASGTDSCAVPSMSSMNTRLYQKAGEGPDTLRRFMDIRRNILQLDIMETMQWAEGLDQARRSCLARVASQGGAESASEPLARTASR